MVDGNKKKLGASPQQTWLLLAYPSLGIISVLTFPTITSEIILFSFLCVLNPCRHPPTPRHLTHTPSVPSKECQNLQYVEGRKEVTHWEMVIMKKEEELLDSHIC